MGLRITELSELTNLQNQENVWFEVSYGKLGAEVSRKVSWANLVAGVNAEGISATINPVFHPSMANNSEALDNTWSLSAKLRASSNTTGTVEEQVSTILTSTNVNGSGVIEKANHLIIGGGNGGGLTFVTSGSRSKGQILSDLKDCLGEDKRIWSKWDGSAMALNLVSDGFIQFFPSFRYPSEGHAGDNGQDKYTCFTHGIRIDANGGITGLKWTATTGSNAYKIVDPAPLYLPKNFTTDSYNVPLRLIVTSPTSSTSTPGSPQMSGIAIHNGVLYTLPVIKTFFQNIQFYGEGHKDTYIKYENNKKVSATTDGLPAGHRVITLNLSSFVASNEVCSISVTSGIANVSYQVLVEDALHPDAYRIRIIRSNSNVREDPDPKLFFTLISHKSQQTTTGNTYYPALPIATL